MSTLLLGTVAVSLDEPAYSLKEILQPAPDSKSVRRVQDIAVVRADRVVHFQRDLGPADRFKATEFCVPGGVADPETGRIYIEHTVGELVDIADYLRSDQYRPPEPPRASNLIGQYRDLPDKRRRWRKRSSQFGAKVRIQRG